LRALALETTSRRGEVALVEEGRVVASGAFEAGLKHTAELVPLIDRLCRSLGWEPLSLEEVYVSAGPGGFTGTRIGVTFAKTFAWAAGRRVVAVPTARVIVEGAPPEAGSALVVVDARRGKAWVQAFERKDGVWHEAGEPLLGSLSEFLRRAARPVWLLGEGVAYHAGDIDAGDAQIHRCADDPPRAAVVAAIGWEMARRGAFADTFGLSPLYVRRPEAEEKRLGA
jgi:tRNA threonylcarbamoyladenosine biosynthesis protein TsaB